MLCKQDFDPEFCRYLGNSTSAYHVYKQNYMVQTLAQPKWTQISAENGDDTAVNRQVRPFLRRSLSFEHLIIEPARAPPARHSAASSCSMPAGPPLGTRSATTCTSSGPASRRPAKRASASRQPCRDPHTGPHSVPSHSDRAARRAPADSFLPGGGAAYCKWSRRVCAPIRRRVYHPPFNLTWKP